MGLILANMAIDITGATAGARNTKHKGLDTEAQRLLPWRHWAIRVLTEVGSTRLSMLD
jgi:hypothetical protein